VLLGEYFLPLFLQQYEELRWHLQLRRGGAGLICNRFGRVSSGALFGGALVALSCAAGVYLARAYGGEGWKVDDVTGYALPLGVAIGWAGAASP
jgi:hypothetical protein